MKRHSFFLRLFVGNLVIVVVAVVVAAVVSYRAVNAQHLRVTNAYQDNLCLIAAQHVEDLWPMPAAEVDRLCSEFLHRERPPHADGGPTLERGVLTRLTIIAADGRVLGDSEGDVARMENHRTDDRPEVMDALAGRPGTDVRRSETLGVEYRYVARPVRHNGTVAAAARVATPVVTVLESQSVLREGILWGSLIAVGAFALIGLLINWLWYAPLRRVTQTARQIASGDLSERAAVQGPAELAQLAAALNAMRDSLAGQIAAVSAQRENLEQVVANLREGVIATNADGRIVLMNRAARAFLAGEDEVVGKHLQDVVRVADIVDAFDEAASARQTVSCQVDTEAGGRHRHVDVHVAPLPGAPAGGIACLVVVRDVTDIVRTAAMKAEFVANASHELRTPLATLRAALEAVEESDPEEDAETYRKALAIMRRHIERLESLTLDLLDLHAVETAKRNGQADLVSLPGLAEWARAHFGRLAAAKNVTLDIPDPQPGPAVATDHRLLELVLQNLLDNAIKFTDAGGQVSCIFRRQNGQLLCRVSDTGCGIPPQDQPRIFERFYQADASRSGDAKVRGTGLGLAIVKHAVERLGGSVSLESEPGKGTTVSVIVPDQAQASSP